MSRTNFPAAALRRPSRRDLLATIGGGFGMAALGSVLGAEASAAGAPDAHPMAPKTPHFPARAKHVIFLFLNGGLSHVDSFDYKPMLDKYDGKPFPGGNPTTERKTGALMRSPFEFARHGDSGLWVSDIFPHVAGVIDKFCVLRSMKTDVPNHEPSFFMMNCGHLQPGRPSWGSWLTYGLGTENRNLPGFVVLCPGSPTVGPPLWSSGFLPGIHEGAYIRNSAGDPGKLIPFISNETIARDEQRAQIDALARLNRMHAAERPGRPELEATIQSMEIAFHMQTEAPEVFDLSRESDETLALYGEGDFARGCLMARRLVEQGVRAVQVYYADKQPWDTHDDILLQKKHARFSDRPIAALVQDLERRGLLDETLVVVGSEFGRTPVVEHSPEANTHNGRDHNPFGFTTLLAGGGVRGGMAYGATDEFGFHAVENVMHVHDLHATMLHLMGFDHTRLTYSYSGRDFRLTDVHGEVVTDILA